MKIYTNAKYSFDTIIFFWIIVMINCDCDIIYMKLLK